MRDQQHQDVSDGQLQSQAKKNTRSSKEAGEEEAVVAQEKEAVVARLGSDELPCPGSSGGDGEGEPAVEVSLRWKDTAWPAPLLPRWYTGNPRQETTKGRI